MCMCAYKYGEGVSHKTEQHNHTACPAYYLHTHSQTHLYTLYTHTDAHSHTTVAMTTDPRHLHISPKIACGLFIFYQFSRAIFFLHIYIYMSVLTRGRPQTRKTWSKYLHTHTHARAHS